MQHRKHLLKICVLLSLFVSVFAAPFAFADGPPSDIEQKFGVGLGVLAGNDVTYLGVNTRFWSGGNLGFEAGWLTDGESESRTMSGVRAEVSARVHLIPVSMLYTVWHVDTNSVYIRPYVGGGINIARLSSKVTVSYQGESISESASDSGFGGQGFVGAEVTFKAVPRLSFGGDIGYYRFGGKNFNFDGSDAADLDWTSKGSGARFNITYYLK